MGFVIMLFLTIVIFIFILGFLIFVHEFAHFIVAKKSGVFVEEFGFGYPPRIVGVCKEKKKWKALWGPKEIKTQSTIYSLNFIPFGGFNKISGENSREKKAGSFYEKSIGTRARIIFAGVAANFLLAAVLFSVVLGIGFPQAIEGSIPPGAKNVGIQITKIAKDSPADKTGIRIGDKIKEMKADNEVIIIKEIEDIQNFTKEHLDSEIIMALERGNQMFEKKVTPRENPPDNEGSIGIGLVKTAEIAYPFPQAIVKGFERTFWLTGATVSVFSKAIKNAFQNQPVEGFEIAGPIGIVSIVSQISDLGWIYLVQFTAILSLNLAIINILPFPALDGGRLIFLFIEKIKKHPVKIEVENLVNQIGFVLLILLMVIVTFKDVQKLF